MLVRLWQHGVCKKMARINIEEEWWSDPRRFRLAESFGYPTDPSGQLKADGLMVRVWYFALKYWKTKEYIPFHAWDGAGFPDELFRVGLAEKHPTGVYVRGSSRHFEWYHRKTAGLTAGSSAGGKSRIKTASRDEKGRLISSKSNIIQPEAQPTSRSSSPSSSSSSSSSEELNTNSPTAGKTSNRACDKKFNFEKEFDEFYSSYPRRIQRSRALKAFMKNVNVPKEYQKLLEALRIYSQKIIAEKKSAEYVQYPATFLNSWRDWLDPTLEQPGKGVTKVEVVDWA